MKPGNRVMTPDGEGTIRMRGSKNLGTKAKPQWKRMGWNVQMGKHLIYYDDDQLQSMEIDNETPSG